MKRTIIIVCTLVLGTLLPTQASHAAIAADKMSGLGQLVILSALFSTQGGGVLAPSASPFDLGNLVILDQLFNDTNHRVFGGARSVSLGEILILNQIAKNNNLFGSNAHELGKLFVLDRLFGG